MKMFGKAKLIGNFYMVFMMTLSVSVIQCIVLKCNFFDFWWKSFVIGLPLAIIYTTFIRAVVGKAMALTSKTESVSAD